MTSPILKTSALTSLGAEHELKAEKMRKIANFPSSKSGTIRLPPSQLQFMEQGLLYVMLTGQEPERQFSNHLSKGKVIADSPMYQSVENLLKNAIEILNPYYAFATSYRDLDFVPNYTEFPPLNAWEFCWRVFVYGKEFITQKGYDVLLKTPAFNVQEIGQTIWIQPTDEIYGDDTAINLPIERVLTEDERKSYREAVKRYLNLREPFDW